MAGGVDSEARGSLTGIERPGCGRFECGGIEAEHHARVFNVDEDVTCAIGDGELRLARHRNGSDDGGGGGVDHGCIVAASVEGEDAMLRRLKEHGIGILSGRNGGENLVGCAIEGEDLAGPAVRYVTHRTLVVEGDAMRVGKTCNLGDDL